MGYLVFLCVLCVIALFAFNNMYIPEMSLTGAQAEVSVARLNISR